MSYENKKFLDANGVTQIVGLLDDYATNETLSTVVNSVQSALDQKVDDVQIDGTSILNNGAANIPVAGPNQLGVLKVGSGTRGVNVSSTTDELQINFATAVLIKSGVNTYCPITPKYVDAAAFYGLASAAGKSMSSVSGATVGVYPDEQKQAILKMLGLDGILGDFESSAVASKTYAIGETFVYSGKRYRVTADIAQGYVINPGTNCELDPIDGKYIRNTDYALSDGSTAGVVIIPAGGSKGIDINSNHELRTRAASSYDLKNGIGSYAPLTPHLMHEAAYYALSKLAGVDLKNETVTVGTYPTNAKTAIRSLIGAAPAEVIAIQDTQPTNTDTKVWMMETPPESVEVPTMEDLAGYVQKTDYATSSTAGLVKPGSGIALESGTGKIYIDNASENQIKGGIATNIAIAPFRQHIATFYGLAKAAGDTTQSSSSNAVGTYTTEAKAAILAMLGAVGLTDYATDQKAGIAKVSNAFGIQMTNNSEVLAVQMAGLNEIKSASNYYKPIVPASIHQAAFFGLAKAANADLANETVTVGTYPQTAKTAIQTMLGIEANIPLIEEVSGSTPTIVGMPNVRYICGEVSLLTITPPAAGSIVVRFSTGSSTTLTVPDTIKWPAWFDATSLDADTTYEIIITDGVYGGVMSWA